MARGTFYRNVLKPVSDSITLPAPVAGLNTRDPIAIIAAQYALNMVNFIATPQGNSVREGYVVKCTGLPGYVETLAPYTGVVGGANRLFGWSQGKIYDVTAPGVVGAPMVSGLTNSLWSWVNMTGFAGQFLVAANGVDAVRHFNGTSWVTWTLVTTPSAPGEMKGVNPNLLNRPIMHQRRLWFVEENSTRAWYCGINEIGGELKPIDFGPSFPRGGRLLALGSMSLDGGAGIQNFLIGVSENGDAAIYEGTDPSSASSRSLAGTWRLGAPTTAKCLFQFGGDVLYLSVDGLMPLSAYKQTTTTQVALSDAIRKTLSEASVSLSTLSGWQLHDVLSKNLLVLNVPQIDPKKNVQFIYNTITKGWSLFTGWPAQCWATLGGVTYFGGLGEVCQAFVGYRDGAAYNGTGGVQYIATAQQAFTYISDGLRSRTKHITLARPNIVSASPTPSLLVAVNADFSTTPPSSVGAAAPVLSSLWDVAVWDSSVWSGQLNNYNAWQSVSSTGYCHSVTIAMSALAETTWVSTDLVYTVGGMVT